MPMEALFYELNQKSVDVTPDVSMKDGKTTSPFLNQNEKIYVEQNTQEKIIINRNGAFASLKDTDKFLPVNTFQQLLYAPFEQINVKVKQ